MSCFRVCCILLFQCFCLSLVAYSQDIAYARRQIDTLASPSMHGRGYVFQGDKIAARYIASQFAKNNLGSFSPDYFQNYYFPINSFPGKMDVSIDGISLSPGYDYTVSLTTSTTRGVFDLVFLSPKHVSSVKKLQKFLSRDFRNKLLVVDKKIISDKTILAVINDLKRTNPIRAKGYLFIEDRKLIWSGSSGPRVADYVVMDVTRDCLPAKAKKISINLENQFYPEYPTQNVIAYVRGLIRPDTFVMVTAHYDHLGRMGKDTYYPGANDNASGTAMLLDMARHYAKSENQPYYSMIFACLSGEETGLQGSTFCADHLPVPAAQIKFLLNLDMVGTGSEGISVMNGTVLKQAFRKLETLNENQQYVVDIRAGGESCNSDHCPFYKKGIPAFFIFTRGQEYTEYHHPDDCREKIPLSEYTNVFKLLTQFLDSLSTFNPAQKGENP